MTFTDFGSHCQREEKKMSPTDDKRKPKPKTGATFYQRNMERLETIKTNLCFLYKYLSGAMLLQYGVWIPVGYTDYGRPVSDTKYPSNVNVKISFAFKMRTRISFQSQTSDVPSTLFSL